MSVCCWAAGHSPCGGGQSREHLISRGVLNQSEVFVQGLPWCAGGEKRIGVSSATAKILCRDHNSALGELDVAAAHAVRGFESVDEVPHPAPVDGLRFERWLLKTAINFAFGKTEHLGWGMVGSKPGEPSRYLLDVVFGTTPFTAEMGAYFLFPSHSFHFRAGEIVLVPITKEQTIGGVYFGLRGVNVFLSLVPGATPASLRALGLTDLPAHVLDALPVFRPPSMTTSTDAGAPRPILIQWS